ncbi:transposase, partial [Desulfotruncus alcoholivorax]
WLNAVHKSGIPELKSFAVSLNKDYAAIFAGLTESWSQGPVEGINNRLKLIKRLMFGRAKFDLLRKRVLLAL